MSNRIVNWLGRTACAALLTLPLVGAQKVTPASENAQGQSSRAERSAWPVETLTGTITMVDPAQHLVVVQDASGVPFDMVVTPATRIRSGDQRLNLGDLSSDVNKNVSLKFVPERRGDVARSIRLNG
jgi:hypothetical protein